jgi:hypothetical protein
MQPLRNAARAQKRDLINGAALLAVAALISSCRPQSEMAVAIPANKLEASQPAPAPPPAATDVRGLGALGDGVRDDAAAINAALIAAAKSGGGVVHLPAGTYLVGQTLLFPSERPITLAGSGAGATTIKLKDGANRDLVSQADFSELSRMSAKRGLDRAGLKDLRLDGNRLRNSKGSGVRWYGRGFFIHNVAIENCAGDGLWTEYSGSDDFSVPGPELEATYTQLVTAHNGGTGWRNKGPHDSIVRGFVSYGNGGWGWNNESPVHAVNVNTYLNAAGGIRSTQAILGSDIAGTTAGGWGMLIEPSGGGHAISASLFAGPIALEIRSPNHTLQAVVANSTTAGVRLKGGSANLQLTMFANQGPWFDVAGQNGGSIVTVQALDDSGTLFNGDPSGVWLVRGAKSFTQLK